MRYRLYIDTMRDRSGYRREGPYHFASGEDAVQWLKGQTHIRILSAALYDGEERIFEWREDQAA